eukprot:gene721-14000_t
MPPDKQQRAFGDPAPGRRKVVVSTNVAETGVTIDGVAHVVDTGRVRRKGWDPALRLGRLEEGWVAAPSAEQRKGRAGRTRPGTAWRLWPRGMLLADADPPELTRCPLEPIVLHCALLRRPAAETLAASAQLAGALDHCAERLAAADAEPRGLCELGALAARAGAAAELTPLGAHLARLPCDPRCAKVVVLGALLGAPGGGLAGRADPVLAFWAPSDAEGRDRASRVVRERFGAKGSDQLAACAANVLCLSACSSQCPCRHWRPSAERGAGGARELAWCDAHYVSSASMRDLDAGRAALNYRPAPKRQLGDAGFATEDAAPGTDGLLRSLLVAARGRLYPNLARSRRERSKAKGGAHQGLRAHQLASGCRPGKPTGARPQAFERLTVGERGEAWMHPSSRQETTRAFLRGTSRASPLAVLLFGAAAHELSHERAKQCGGVDLAGCGFRVGAAAEAVLLLKAVRREFDDALRLRAEDPGPSLLDCGGLWTAA